MNHLGDTNKMVDTPRTDEFIGEHSEWSPAPRKNLDAFARQLERELNAANDRVKRLEEDLMDAKNKHAALVADVVLYEDRGERIKRLEEELERTKQDRNAIAKKTREPLLLKLDHAAERIKRLEAAGDVLCAAAAFMGWHMEIENWRKAKEAKP